MGEKEGRWEEGRFGGRKGGKVEGGLVGGWGGDFSKGLVTLL